ncbi:MAG: WYL domain-containing protein, partial [Eubacteriaceae bacterium]|nr:WYL domain-containing protein [Eubacteriaceae bacterium]
HMLSTRQIMTRMETEHGITMHRTTLPKDVEVLRTAGIEVMSERKRALYYYLADRSFSIPEIRILIDAVMSSKFITDSKSQALIDKLISLTSDACADKLRRTVHVTGKAKSDNEKGYYIVDTVNEAINLGRKISFHYYDYDGKKHHVLKNDGAPYTVSPYDLIWDGDYYYLTGLCDERDEVRVFRVDRIEKQPKILEDLAVKPSKGYRVEKFTQEVFRMFATQETTEVRLLCDNSIMKAIIDKFGTGVRTKAIDEDHFRATVKVCTSPTFYRWVFGWDGMLRIEGPEEVVKEYGTVLLTEIEQYKEHLS